MSRMYDPPHPGAVLRESVFTDTGVTIAGFARRIGVSRTSLSRVLNCRTAIDADFAIRLSVALGGTAESWLRMQTAYDLWQARQAQREVIEPLGLGTDAA